MFAACKHRKSKQVQMLSAKNEYFTAFNLSKQFW